MKTPVYTRKTSVNYFTILVYLHYSIRLKKVPVNRNGPDMPGVIFSDNGSPNVPKVGQLQDVLQVKYKF